MKSFLAATAFFVVALAVSALLHILLDRSTTDAFARESARVEQPAAADGRLGWAGEDAGGRSCIYRLPGAALTRLPSQGL
jgi:hypothetical protein